MVKKYFKIRIKIRLLNLLPLATLVTGRGLRTGQTCSKKWYETDIESARAYIRKKRPPTENYVTTIIANML